MIHKNDLWIIGVCLVTAAVLTIYFYVKQNEGGEQLLRISYDGEILENRKLDENILQEESIYYLFLYENDSVMWEKFEEYPDIPEGVSFNLLCISRGDIWMEAADCRDQICVNHKPISGGGESIICLPHRLVAEVVGRKDEETPDRLIK